MIAYRIHSADESLETVMDPSRPDGWVASDEHGEAQPHGVSACLSLDHLRRYMRLYSLTAQPGDVLLELRGRLGDPDRDHHAVRIVVESYRVLGEAAGLLRERDEDSDDDE